jgi:hypothetical protein
MLERVAPARVRWPLLALLGAFGCATTTPGPGIAGHRVYPGSGPVEVIGAALDSLTELGARIVSVQLSSAKDDGRVDALIVAGAVERHVFLVHVRTRRAVPGARASADAELLDADSPYLHVVTLPAEATPRRRCACGDDLSAAAPRENVAAIVLEQRLLVRRILAGLDGKLGVRGLPASADGL